MHVRDSEAAAAPRPSVEPHKRSHRDLLAAIASGVVATVALLSSMYNVYLQRQQVRAAVWPRLDEREEYTPDEYKIFVTNHGAGPAIVRRVRVTLDGKPMASWGALMDAFPADVMAQVPPGTTIQMQGMSNLIGTISPGGEKPFFQINDPGVLAMMVAGSRVQMDVCYCSTLDDCWSWRSDFAFHDETVAVDGCPADAVPFRIQTTSERAVTIARIRESLAERAAQTARDAGSDAR